MHRYRARGHSSGAPKTPNPHTLQYIVVGRQFCASCTSYFPWFLELPTTACEKIAQTHTTP